jgi:hypothetical protein
MSSSLSILRVHRSGFKVHCSRLKVKGKRLKVKGKRFKVKGKRLKAIAIECLKAGRLTFSPCYPPTLSPSPLLSFCLPPLTPET